MLYVHQAICILEKNRYKVMPMGFLVLNNGKRTQNTYKVRIPGSKEATSFTLKALRELAAMVEQQSDT
jgi:hypothetical protein